MQYHGKLYGKIGGKLIPLKLTSDDVDELERDKARLDWLADPENEIGAVQLPTGAVLENLHSLRAAIDAAMSGNYERNAPIVEPSRPPKHPGQTCHICGAADYACEHVLGCQF